MGRLISGQNLMTHSRDHLIRRVSYFNIYKTLFYTNLNFLYLKSFFFVFFLTLLINSYSNPTQILSSLFEGDFDIFYFLNCFKSILYTNFKIENKRNKINKISTIIKIYTFTICYNIYIGNLLHLMNY